MNDAKRFFVISTILCLVLGVFFFVYFQYLEYKARQELPPKRRTPEAIQYFYDGSVCLGCDIAGVVLLMFFIALGTFTAIVWGLYETFSKKQQKLK